MAFVVLVAEEAVAVVAVVVIAVAGYMMLLMPAPRWALAPDRVTSMSTRARAGTGVARHYRQVPETVVGLKEVQRRQRGLSLRVAAWRRGVSDDHHSFTIFSWTS